MYERTFYKAYPCIKKLRKNEHYLKLIRKYYRMQHKLIPTLTEEQLKYLDKLLTVAEEIESVAVAEHYIDGFDLGVKSRNKTPWTE